MSVVASAFLLPTAETVALRAFTRPEIRARVFDSITEELACAPIVNKPIAASTMSVSAVSLDTAFTFTVPPLVIVISASSPIVASVSPAVFSASKPTSPVKTAMPKKSTSASPARVASALTIELCGGDLAVGFGLGAVAGDRLGDHTSAAANAEPA